MMYYNCTTVYSVLSYEYSSVPKCLDKRVECTTKYLSDTT
jgi:hypothetical protein